MTREPNIPGLHRTVRNVGRSIERDIDEELAFHIESRVQELVAGGQPLEIARRIAETEFGDVRASRRELAAVDRDRRRREHVSHWFDAARMEIGQAARSLRRSPVFTLAAVLTLTIGIGATVTIFAVVNGVLLRPLPYRNPERLVAALHDMPPLGLAHEPQSAQTYFTYRRLAHTIDGIGVYREGDVSVAEPGSAAEPQRLTSAGVSATLLQVLQVAPLIGQTISEDDDRPGAAPVMLIHESVWRTRFGADPGVIGRTLDVDGITRRIIGVMPARFQFPNAATRVWIPLQLDPVRPPQIAFGYGGVARLKPGVTPADAERDFAAVFPQIASVYPDFVPGISTAAMIDQMHPRPVLVQLKSEVTGSVAGILWTVAAAAILLLLVACANVANLTLVRADAHQRELAIREALGAGRARVMLHFFAESAVVVALAAMFGLVGAALAVQMLLRASSVGIPRLAEVNIDASTVAFTLAVAAVVAAACSLIPALQARRSSAALREGGRTGTTGRVQLRFRGALVASQVALSLVVLAGSLLLARTFQRLHTVRPGFDPERASTFWVALPAARYPGDTSVVRFYSRLVDRISAMPGVTVVGLTSRLPFEVHGSSENPLYPEGDQTYATKLPPLQLFTWVSGDYFRAMRIPILAGKSFQRMDAQRGDEAIVSRTTAEFFWKDSTGIAALGKQFRPLPNGRLYTVIGVAGETHDTTLAGAPTQAVYFPESGARAIRTMALVVRTEGDRISVASGVRQAVRESDALLPVFDARPMTEVYGAATAQLTFIVLVLGFAAVVTLILGGVGLYGVLAYVVTLRTRELGIRIALGASPSGVAAAMTRYGMTLAGIGVAIGLAMFTVVARFLRSLLFGVTPGDPVTLAGSAMILLAIAMAASWAPARRASRVDPAGSLRAE